MVINMKYILNEINTHPSLEEQDLVKLIYQRTYGPRHILTNLEMGRNYLEYECKHLNEKLYGNIEISDTLIRIDLHYVSDLDMFFSKLIETSKNIEGDINLYKTNIELLIKCIKDNNLNFDIERIIELASLNEPIHHSPIYNKLYSPHYRIIDKAFIKELGIQY